MSEGAVRAKRFEVVDDDGNVRASMGLDRGGAARLILRGPGGGRGVTAVASEHGTALGVLDGKGEAVMAFGTDPSGGHGLLISEDGGTVRFWLVLHPDGSLIYEVRDENGDVWARGETDSPRND